MDKDQIVEMLRAIGTKEGYDTVLHYGGHTYEILDDGTVLIDGK